jgi:hypothetical protein
MECNCSICRNKGAIYSPANNNHLKITQGEDSLTLYQFGTKTAKHYFCKHCGIHPFVNPRLNPNMWLVNVRCLHGVELENIKSELFDGKNWEAAAKKFMQKNKHDK